jgi:hypothetical protein
MEFVPYLIVTIVVAAVITYTMRRKRRANE